MAHGVITFASAVLWSHILWMKLQNTRLPGRSTETLFTIFIQTPR